MWQSSMLISLLVLSPEQIFVPMGHVSIHNGPITRLEPSMVLIYRHTGSALKKSKNGRGGGASRIGDMLMVFFGVIWYFDVEQIECYSIDVVYVIKFIRREFYN